MLPLQTVVVCNYAARFRAIFICQKYPVCKETQSSQAFFRI
uniref:Cell division cycle protein 23 n=1 Tax=Arundo donax TaxID=35708 RepID=A0A0A9FP56_ARUDO